MSGLPFDWQLDQKINQAISGKVDRHEISTLRSDVDSLERSNRQIRTEVDELRAWVERLQDCEISRLREEISKLQGFTPTAIDSPMQSKD